MEAFQLSLKAHYLLPGTSCKHFLTTSQTDILHIDCVLHTMSDFLYRKGPDGRPLAERFPPYTPLLEMVKALAGAGT